MDEKIRNVQVTRYVTPLREGGSLPAIVEADDGFLYVLKFRGAGQGGINHERPVRSFFQEIKMLAF